MANKILHDLPLASTLGTDAEIIVQSLGDTELKKTTLSSVIGLVPSIPASEVLSKLKTVDGTGSGLDADTIDGHNSTYFEVADAAIQTHLSNTTKHRLINDTSTSDTELWSARKVYDTIESALHGHDWQDSVLDKDLNEPPSSPTVGARYIVSWPAAAATGAWLGHDNEIAEWNGTGWSYTVVTEGTALWMEDEDAQYVWNGSVWAKIGSTTTHNNTSGLQGGAENDYQHLTTTQVNKLDSLAASYQQVSANFPGEVTAQVGTSRWFPPRNIEIVDVTALIRLVPSSSNCVVDVLKNGVSIFSPNPKPTISIGQSTSGVIAATAGTTLTITDALTVNLDTANGSDLFIRIRYI